MAEFGEPQLAVKLENRGDTLTRVKAYNIDSSYTVPTDGLEFTLYDQDRSKLSGLELEPVDILINGKSQALGRIEITEFGADGTAVVCRGRDYISDMVECHVDPSLVIKKEMDLSAVVTLAAGPVGIDTVLGDDDLPMRNVRTGKRVATRGTTKDFKSLKQEDYKANPGEGIYAFLNRIVARHGGTIQPATTRNAVVLTAPRFEQEPTYSIVRRVDDPPGAHNVVKSATATRDFSSFPTYCLFTGKFGRGGKTRSPGVSEFSTADVAREIGGELSRLLPGRVASGRIKPGETPDGLYRLYNLRDEDSRNQSQMDHAALRAFAERFKPTLTYRCTLRGHEDPFTGTLWAVDTIVRVQDEVCGIDEPLWIASRTFSYSPGSGVTTTLECWRPGAYQLNDE